MTLYEMTNEFLESGDNEENLISKLEAYAKVIKSFEADEISLKSEIDRLNKRLKDVRERKDDAASKILSTMLVMDKKKIQSNLFHFTITSRPDKLVVDDEASVPTEFLKPQLPKLDKKALNQWAKEHPEEVEKFGHYERSDSLLIR